jgi:four helix bundle protein
MMGDYRKLKVWHRAIDFVANIYKETSAFPSHELYGLTSQMRRAATSVALNIAEGASSGYEPEYQRFLRMAIRSVNEVATGFEIARRLAYCGPELAAVNIAEADEIAAMLQGLSKSLKQVSEPNEEYKLDIEEVHDRGDIAALDDARLFSPHR